MEKKLLEKKLEELGIDFVHTANRGTGQMPQSVGHYNLTGCWIEEDSLVPTEPDGIEIKDFQQEYACNYCENVLDRMPIIQLSNKFNRFKSSTWLVKCLTCKKGIDYQVFKNAPDK
jgi:hypothetical protein